VIACIFLCLDIFVKTSIGRETVALPLLNILISFNTLQLQRGTPLPGTLYPQEFLTSAQAQTILTP
jgi:hypothetical protein